MNARERPVIKEDVPRTMEAMPWLLLVVFAVICFGSMSRKSVTVDEFAHFPAGIYNVFARDWAMNRESPPLVKCLPAISVFITRPTIAISESPSQMNAWAYGYDFMFRNRDAYTFVFGAGRCAIVLLACLAGYLLFRFAREIFGYRAALFGLFLYVFNPNIIAHSRLTTIDVGAACMFLLSVYSFWKFVEDPTPRSTVLAGIAMGLVQLSKFTALILYPAYLLILSIATIHRLRCIDSDPVRTGASQCLRPTAYFALIVLISVAVINAGYLLSDTFTPLKEYRFQSTLLKDMAQCCSGSLPIPLPKEYVSGFDEQLAVSEGGRSFYRGYLMGKHSNEGWWYYYLVAFLVKNQTALLIILLSSVIFWLMPGTYKPPLNAALCIWVPIIILFGYFSFFTNIPIGIRYMLPLFPLLFIAAGNLIHLSWMRRRAARVVMILLMAAYLLPTLIVYPNYLSYFNLLAGGPGNGHKWLIDSNLDWGQDLPALREYMDAQGIEKIHLGYFGRVDPRIYGVEYDLADENPESGVTVISVNFIVGRPYYLLDPETMQLKLIDADYYQAYRALEPTRVIGNTLYVFEKNG